MDILDSFKYVHYFQAWPENYLAGFRMPELQKPLDQTQSFDFKHNFRFCHILVAIIIRHIFNLAKYKRIPNIILHF